MHGAPSISSRSSPKTSTRPALRQYDTGSNAALTDDLSSVGLEEEQTYRPVIARISTHTLRLEREFHLCRSFKQTSDPDCKHTVRPLELTKLPAVVGANEPMLVSVFESPGRNYLVELVDFGKAWLRPSGHDSRTFGMPDGSLSPRDQVSLLTFLDFAVGATECLELLHHGMKVVHGELRADAFHFHQHTRAVRLVNFGSGPRSFEDGLTSAGWSKLSRELGIKNKLQFVAPEQTGRLPGNPDSRSDIYSLGVLLWTMLTGEPAFDGKAPIDVIQAVLNRKLPTVSSKRMDVPVVLSNILQKMTQKQIDERYRSTSGLKYDLVELQRMLAEGDGAALLKFNIGSKDVSSTFMLPNEHFGRAEEHQKIISVIDKVVKRQPSGQDRNGGSGIYSVTSGSTSTPSETYENGDEGIRSSSVSSIGQASNTINSSTILTNGTHRPSLSDKDVNTPLLEKPTLETTDSRDSVQTTFSIDSLASTTGPSASQRNVQPALQWASTRPRTSQKYKVRHRCEVIVISGDAGLGKSSLITSAQSDIRGRSGYSATAKFERKASNPFECVFRSVSSLFRQIFSESNISGEYHNSIRRQLKPFWPSLCSMLDLPANLISSEALDIGTLSKFAGNSMLSQDSSMTSGTKSTQNGVSLNGTLSTTGAIRASTASKSLKIINSIAEVFRVLSTNKLICLCLDDLQYADGESLELVASIVARKLGVVLLISCRDEGSLPSNIKSALDDRAVAVTRIQMSPLGEHEVTEFVAATMHREKNYISPLAMVCLERTNGNPFYLRQMLEVCHQKGCIWYTWKESAWEFDLDRVFREFETESYGQKLDNDFLTRRLRDLPPAARSILAWASLLGSTFSFEFLQRLLLGECKVLDDTINEECGMTTVVSDKDRVENIVEGLNACMQALVLNPGSDEDHFSFSHDRYIQASGSLRECCDVEKMHFLIARTMMKYSYTNTICFYALARHIQEASRIINEVVRTRRKYRQVLLQAAHRAIESGSRSTALQHLETCISLMQPKPWVDGPDIDYAETLECYCKAADLYWHEGQFPEAQGMIDDIHIGARSATDKSSAWILQSKILARQGKLVAAFDTLKMSLAELGIVFPTPTEERCDQEYLDIRERLRDDDQGDLSQKPSHCDPQTAALGMVLCEAISAALWNDSLVSTRLQRLKDCIFIMGAKYLYCLILRWCLS